MSAVWILTDSTYLAQRMPSAVLGWLEAQGRPARVVVADRGAVLTSLAPLGGPGDVSVWQGLAPGDLVLPRSRHPFALALLKEAEVRGALSVNPWTAVIKSGIRSGTPWPWPGGASRCRQHSWPIDPVTWPPSTAAISLSCSNPSKATMHAAS